MKKLLIIIGLLQIMFTSSAQLALDTTDNFCIGAEQLISQFEDWSRPRIFDFDNDGDKDFAVIEDFADSLAVYINNGTADFTLAKPIKILTSGNLVDLAISDFDLDGFIDIVTIADNGDLYFYQNVSGTSLSLAGNVGNTIMPTLRAHKIEVHDLNNDGLADIIGSGEDYSLGTFYAFTFQQSVTFTFFQMTPIPIFAGHTAQVNLPQTHFDFADFDADGFQDFAIGCEDLLDTIEVYKNAGTMASITFVAVPSTFTNSASGYTKYIKTTDCTGDGMPDISIASSGGFSINQNMASAMTFSAYITDLSIFCSQFDFADLNSDNMKDVVTCDFGSYNIYVGTSFSQINFWSGIYNNFNLFDRRSFALADFDSNAIPDFLFVGTGDMPYLQVSRNFTFNLKNTIVSTNTAICGSTPVDFTVTSSHPTYPGNYNWTPGPSTTTSLSTTTAGGVYSSFSYTLPPGLGQCTIGSNTIYINSQSTPSAPITATVSAINCPGTSVPLEASIPVYTTYTWSTGQSTYSILVSPTTTTTYSLFLNNGCPGVEIYTVNVSPNPTVSISAPSTSICTGDSLLLTGNGGVNYLWLPGSSTTSSIYVKPTNTTGYSLVGTNSFGCSDTGYVNITVNTVPVLSVVPSKTLICFPDTVTLIASGAPSYTWSTGSNTSTISVLVFSGTNYTLSGSNGCKATVVYTLTGFARPSITAVSSKPTVCSGDSVLLQASGAASYTWAPLFQFGSTVFDYPGGPTTYSVLGISTNGCYNYATVSVGLNNPPMLSIVSSELCLGKSATITATGATSYLWDDNSTNASFAYTPTSTTPISFTVCGTDAIGCKSTLSKTFSISDQCTLVVWNGITPNGDGHNDYFRIDNIEQYPGNKVLIFNRWGQKLAEIDDYNNANRHWEGTAIGDQQVPSGTYYYVIDLKNGSDLLKGYIELTKRDTN